ncbi:MAG: hypothetical protein R2784_14065 [Saprospiraceae bacterium]
MPNGTAELSPANYTYTWLNTGANGNLRTDLSAGTYDVQVRDDNTGCVNYLQVVIDQVNPLKVTPVIISQPTCNAFNGVVSLSIENGSGAYSYSWGIDSISTILGTGFQSVTVVDNQTGCQAIAEFTLDDTPVMATVLANDVFTSCYESADANADFLVETPSGYANPYTIEIRDSSGTQYQDGQLEAGNYCLFVMDANGCETGMACFAVLNPIQ